MFSTVHLFPLKLWPQQSGKSRVFYAVKLMLKFQSAEIINYVPKTQQYTVLHNFIIMIIYNIIQINTYIIVKVIHKKFNNKHYIDIANVKHGGR